MAIVAVCVVGAARAADLRPGITVYNQNFAVVRDLIPLDLKKGTTQVSYNEITAHLEPSSVILRDPAGKVQLQILEQNFRGDPVSQNLLLSLYEGVTIQFLVRTRDGTDRIVKGKIIRSGYVPHQQGLRRYGQQYYQRQMVYSRGAAGQPIIEVDGKLRFTLPGTPLFPALTDDSVLKPTINWLIKSDRAGKLNAELCYVTGGMSWAADYNVVSPEKSDLIDLVGWVTIDNQSGKGFRDARIKLMAGDVSKIQQGPRYAQQAYPRASAVLSSRMDPAVTQKAFDEYHLYTLKRRTTLRDRETKQVEFVRATGIKSKRVYVYNGAKIDWRRYRGWSQRSIMQDAGFGTQCNPKVWVMREFKNTKANQLGIPLPKGKVRFYRRDDDGQLEFTGENVIDHTPKDETVRAYTGNAFDLVGERRRTKFKLDSGRSMLDEAFEIKLRNHKKEAVEIRVIEPLYRWSTWEITESSKTYLKKDSRTIEFRVQVKPDGEQTITYQVRYTW